MRKSDPSTPTEREGERAEEEEAQGKHGHGKRERGCDGEPGGGSPDGAKESGDCVKSEEDLRGVGEGKEHQHRHGQGATESLGERAASCDHGNVVLVSTGGFLQFVFRKNRSVAWPVREVFPFFRKIDYTHDPAASRVFSLQSRSAGCVHFSLESLPMRRGFEAPKTL